MLYTSYNMKKIIIRICIVLVVVVVDVETVEPEAGWYIEYV